MPEKPHILFVCSRNKWRSPTAEATYANDARVEVRAVGLSGKSPRQLSEVDLQWADIVLVMERGHKARILNRFRDFDILPRIEVMEIPDEYEYMDEELVGMIRSQTEHFIEKVIGIEQERARDCR